MRFRSLLAVGASIAVLAFGTISASVASGAATAPGVSVTQIADLGPSVVPVATGVALIVGVGGPSTPVLVTSSDPVSAMLPNASPSLSTAVQQFFIQGGQSAFVLGAAGSDGASISSAFSGTLPIGADLYIAVDLGSSSGSEWLGAAAAMARAAARTRSVAILDAPQSLITAAMHDSAAVGGLTAIAGQLRSTLGSSASSAFLLGSGLVLDGAVIGAAAPYAGVIARTDQQDGTWVAAANTPFDGVTPQWNASNVIGGTMNVAGVAAMAYWPGRGAIVRSDRTLATSGSGVYMSVVRTLDTIEASIANWSNQFVFDANDATTWSAVTAGIGSYLTDLWQQGALVGATASDAYSVVCGLGTSMTPQDILNGQMIITVDVALMRPAEFTSFTQMVLMQQ